MQFQNPIHGILNMLHGNLPWNNVMPPHQNPTHGTQPIQQAPVRVGAPNSPQGHSSVLQGNTPVHIQRDPNGEVIGYPMNLQGNPTNLQANVPLVNHVRHFWDGHSDIHGFPFNIQNAAQPQVNPAGHETMTIPVNPRPTAYSYPLLPYMLNSTPQFQQMLPMINYGRQF